MHFKLDKVKRAKREKLNKATIFKSQFVLNEEIKIKDRNSEEKKIKILNKLKLKVIVVRSDWKLTL